MKFQILVAASLCLSVACGDNIEGDFPDDGIDRMGEVDNDDVLEPDFDDPAHAAGAAADTVLPQGEANPFYDRTLPETDDDGLIEQPPEVLPSINCAEIQLGEEYPIEIAGKAMNDSFKFGILEIVVDTDGYRLDWQSTSRFRAVILEGGGIETVFEFPGSAVESEGLALENTGDSPRIDVARFCI